MQAERESGEPRSRSQCSTLYTRTHTRMHARLIAVVLHSRSWANRSRLIDQLSLKSAARRHSRKIRRIREGALAVIRSEAISFTQSRIQRSREILNNGDFFPRLRIFPSNGRRDRRNLEASRATRFSRSATSSNFSNRRLRNFRLARFRRNLKLSAAQFSIFKSFVPPSLFFSPAFLSRQSRNRSPLHRTFFTICIVAMRNNTFARLQRRSTILRLP